jgi:hypothetical protein
VRGPGKSSGAFGFACIFLCFFLLGKQKKEGEELCQDKKWSRLSLTNISIPPFLLKERVGPKVQGEFDATAELN